MLAGTGTMHRLTHLYSRPPYERVMGTVIDDPVGEHFAWNGGRCSAGVYSVRDDIGAEAQHRTCQGNLEEAIAPWGFEADLVPDIFNIFMHTDVIDEHELVFKESLAQPAITSTSVQKSTCWWLYQPARVRPRHRTASTESNGAGSLAAMSPIYGIGPIYGIEESEQQWFG